MSNYTRRKFNHDYKGVCSYHIVFRKNDCTPYFGELRIDTYKAPKDDDHAVIRYSQLGRIILKEIYNFHICHPQIVVTQYKVMPDHVHLLIRVMVRLPHHAGFYLGLFMSAVTKKWRHLNGDDSSLPRVLKITQTVLSIISVDMR